jgi:glucose-1-phosphate cytidylyltransferase
MQRQNKMREPVMNDKKEMPPAIILCGGQGTRLRDVTELLPKPMVPIGPQPIVWHIMKCYASFGVRRFILCLGYMREAFINYFLHYNARASDITLKLGQRSDITYHNSHGEEDWEVTLADTGDRTMTGGRIARASKYLLPSDEEFFLTYGDAVSDINISALLEKHRQAQKILTVSAVNPEARFGGLELAEDGSVISFREKPKTDGGLINGGYMVASKQMVDRYLNTSSDLIFEQDPIDSIVNDGQMVAYEHHGYWQCMDTAREHALLNELWDTGEAPWKRTWS